MRPMSPMPSQRTRGRCAYRCGDGKVVMGRMAPPPVGYEPETRIRVGWTLMRTS
jgi:hypothetical protein